MHSHYFKYFFLLFFSNFWAVFESPALPQKANGFRQRGHSVLAFTPSKAKKKGVYFTEIWVRITQVSFKGTKTSRAEKLQFGHEPSSLHVNDNRRSDAKS